MFRILLSTSPTDDAPSPPPEQTKTILVKAIIGYASNGLEWADVHTFNRSLQCRTCLHKSAKNSKM